MYFTKRDCNRYLSVLPRVAIYSIECTMHCYIPVFPSSSVAVGEQQNGACRGRVTAQPLLQRAVAWTEATFCSSCVADPVPFGTDTKPT